MNGEAAKAEGSLLSALGSRWFWYSILCLFCFAGYAIVSKLGTQKGVPDDTLYWLFIWGALPVGLLLLACRRFRLERSARGIGSALAFGTLGGLGQWMVLRALKEGPGESAVIFVVTGLYSMVTVLLAVLFLREKLALVQVAGILFALGAVVVLSLPGDLSQMRVARFPPPWFLSAMIVLVGWGIVGIFQKIASSHISAESALVWQTVAFLLFLPAVWPSEALSKYEPIGLVWGLLGGTLTNLGTLFLVGAMKSGGKASIVAPLTTLFPLLVVLVAPFLFKESITTLQGAGVGCAVVSILLLAR